MKQLSNYTPINEPSSGDPKESVLTPSTPRKLQKKGGKKLMVWGAIKSSGEKVLVKFEGNVNSEKYIAVLKDHLLPFMDLGELFQQDNAPPHTAQKTQFFCGKWCGNFGKLATTVARLEHH